MGRLCGGGLRKEGRRRACGQGERQGAGERVLHGRWSRRTETASLPEAGARDA
ncbi:hypothetical protein LF41_982 [Lysobacter dokdonensis DS-58]|uniref:Uncharacterized protein n=1 Tax=Lysobacter dokdonensis DS-58 TaxID=1300345 RepID=A0A0A2WQ67_9GAMM|nr:hypothetical protein LF41_982 [Lysobacter dokdonensis DS-58]